MNRLNEIEERINAIKGEIDHEDADLDALETELNELTEERKEIMDKVEKRKAMLERVANMPGAKVIEEFGKGDEEVEERFNADSKEYRNAFLKSLLGEKLTKTEERAYTHTTENTGAVVPTELQNKIYSNMEEKHPLLADVQVLRTGAVLSITKHTSIDEGDAKEVAEGEANEDEQNTFVEVSLSGKDFSKHIDFSYRLGKMAISAFESYLVTEIGNRIGAAMTRYIVAQIKADVHVDNKINTEGALGSSHVLNGLSKLKQTGRVYVYTNNSTLYSDLATIEEGKEKLTFLNNLQDSVSAQILGKGVKEEDALADDEILVLDPQQFIFNVVQDIMIERDKDIKKHVHTIAGFAIAEGTLTNDKAAAVLTVTPGI